MSHLEVFFEGSPDPLRYANDYLRSIARLLERLDPKPIARFIQVIELARQHGRQIFFIGNGGSAATASHFANDVAASSRTWEKPYRAVSLTDNVATITAIANDFGYEHIFVRQLEIHMCPGDLVVAISVSGNSPNVVGATAWARAKGALTIGLTGFDGGKLSSLVDIHVHVPTPEGEYGPAEDLHMIVDHLIASYLKRINRQREVRCTSGGAASAKHL